MLVIRTNFLKKFQEEFMSLASIVLFTLMGMLLIGCTDNRHKNIEREENFPGPVRELPNPGKK